MNWIAVPHYLLALLLAPLLLGVVNRTKAFFAGRRGQPLLQSYHDLAKLFGKGAVYSRTTTWVFRAGPLVALACMLVALAMLPWGGARALLAFPGDFFVLAYILGLARFVTVIAALDTGSSFEGMGASREVQFSALAEPALLLALAGLGRLTHSLSLSAIFAAVTPALWSSAGAFLVLTAVALLIVFLVENARIPFDDPNTHLELTMIHEVMVLDHGGPDFGLISYGVALKLWLLGSLVSGLAVPVRTGLPAFDTGAALLGIFAVAVVTGIVESTMARLRLLRVPQLLLSASLCGLLAILLQTGVAR